MTEILRNGAATGLVVIGVAVMTVGVYGLLRMPDVYLQLHASSKTVVFGVIAILVAAAIVADERTSVYRALLIAAFVLLTTPVAAHSVARAAHLQGEAMQGSEAGHESRSSP